MVTGSGLRATAVTISSLPHKKLLRCDGQLRRQHTFAQPPLPSPISAVSIFARRAEKRPNEKKPNPVKPRPDRNRARGSRSPARPAEPPCGCRVRGEPGPGAGQRGRRPSESAERRAPHGTAAGGAPSSRREGGGSPQPRVLLREALRPPGTRRRRSPVTNRWRGCKEEAAPRRLPMRDTGLKAETGETLHYARCLAAPPPPAALRRARPQPPAGNAGFEDGAAPARPRAQPNQARPGPAGRRAAPGCSYLRHSPATPAPAPRSGAAADAQTRGPSGVQGPACAGRRVKSAPRMRPPSLFRC